MIIKPSLYTSKYNLIVSVLFIYFNGAFSQTTKVVYKTYVPDLHEKIKKIEKNADLPGYAKEIVKNALLKDFAEEYELYFDKNKAIFQKIPKLSTSDGNVDQNSINVVKVYYKNNSEKLKCFFGDVTGSKNKVIVPFDEYRWEIFPEKKDILGFTCFKATTKIITTNRFTNQETVNTRTAWFTPTISASFGPQGFDGLPGLVLETTNFANVTITAVKIEFNVKKNIAEPKSTNSITVTDYNKKVIEMRQNEN